MPSDILGTSEYEIVHGDCIEVMEQMPPNSVDFSVFSPPFPALYAYTDSAADVGNVDVMGDEATLHLRFFYSRLAKILKPGRAAVVHVMQIPRMKRTGETGLCDFRGINIRLAERSGLVYEYDWSVRKNPQAQAIRTKSRELQFAGLESDRSKQRGSLPDYLLKFRKPGENAVRINTKGQVSRNDWIQWAECCWMDINEQDTLNISEGRSEEDVKHICPLQLEVIRRCVLLYSNPGEIVFSPFTGIGSEGFVSLGGKSPKTGKQIADPRRFFGCELKPSYFNAALANMGRAIKCRNEKQAQKSLFVESI
jgi:DNA modification methylase